MKFKSLKNNLINKVVLLVAMCSLLGFFFNPSFYATGGETVNINSAAAFSQYALEYYGGSHNPDDVLVIDAPSIIDENFISLGTSDRPFSGTIKVSTINADTFVLFNSPLFDYVSTDAKILDMNGDSYSFKIIRALERINDPGDDYASYVQSSGALFANHVTMGTGSATWSVELLSHSTLTNPLTTEASSFEGVIGDIASGASVSINFNNTSSLNVSGSSSIGLICGTVNTGATLEIATSGSASGISVSTTSGDSGGLVGVMNTGSTLKFNSINNSGVTSVSSTNGRAGGIVGWCSEVTILFDGSVAQYGVSGSVSATKEAGGLFGYFKPVDSTFYMSKYSIAPGMNIASGSGNVSGGVIGFLESNLATFTFDGNKSGSQTINVVLSGGKNRGGVIGNYRTNSLNNTLNITNTRVVVSGSDETTGGLLGTIYNQSGNPAVAYPAYVAIYGNEVVASNVYGGLISYSGNSGPFIDVYGTNTISGTGINAGAVGNMDTGVLRFQGILDLSSASFKNWDSGQVVRERNKSLIYALGTGSSGWILKRNTSKTTKNVNVIGWGDVLRVDGTNLVESDLFSITNHALTINQAYSTITSLTEFVLTALNIQLNDGNIGALNFTSGASNTSSTLRSGTITLGADIDLAGTGILGFTRDKGTIQSFSGTLNGQNHTITLTIGEIYGVNSSGTDLNSINGYIDTYMDRHTNNGLFAKINGATVSNLVIDGYFRTYPGINDINFGALATEVEGTVTVSNVAVNVDIDVTITSSKTFVHGGLFAKAGNNSLNLTITDCSISPVITDNTENGKNYTDIYYLGGVLGRLDYTSTTGTQSITISDSIVGIDYTRTNTYTSPIYFGGVIGQITESYVVKTTTYYKTYDIGDRTITIEDTEVDTTVSNVKNNGSVASGALGTDWLCCDVTLSNVEINADLDYVTTARADYGGLLHIATGYMKVDGLTLSTGAYGIPNVSGSTFGFIANKTSTTNCALFLVVNNSGNNYDITSLAFSKSPVFATFDEIVCDSRFEGANITNNGNSVVSIETSGNIINTTGSTYNSYLNKTTYGKTSSYYVNANTRYYYNLDNALSNLSTPSKKFLIWSVGVYSHSSISDWFDVGTTTFSGSLDMTGLSYYPIDYSGSVTFSSTTTIKLDNELMERYVKYAYYTDANTNSATRTTLSNTNQHYLMHTSLFRNFVGTLSFSGTTIQGNVPKMSDSSVGFLISGTFGDHETTGSILTINGLTLDGVYITNSGAHLTTNIYAPLIINNVGKKTSLTIDGVSQSTTAYTSYNTNGYYAASSLIGDVGGATATAVTITFEDMKLDGRRNAVSIDDLNTKYGTSKSIFSRSTLLNSFIYSSQGIGSYIFSIEDDWGNGTTKPRNVTYGKEITASLENAGKQNKYENGYFVSPTTYQASSEYDFTTSNNFLPYVYVSYNLGENKHELQVNITNNTFIEGCGKYGDPYRVTGEQLTIISKIIHGQQVGSETKINLPSDVLSLNWTSTSYTKYKYSAGSPYTSTDTGSSDVPQADAIKYLAGAYYLIDGEITLGADFISLGTLGTDVEAYAFHGVIVGKNSANIINLSNKPLVDTSTGCVIKDLTVQVGDNTHNVAVSIASPLASGSYMLTGGMDAYGALIRQIVGGDTIIDNVDVDFHNITITFTGNDSTHFERLIPVGGYVGVVVNGGLIFRNMSSSYVGLTNSDFNKIDNEGYLYVNPIIGRVIAGYAFHETASTYNTTSNYVDNGSKNYVISDLSLALGKMSITRPSNNVFNVSIPNGQAIYVLGAIINSGAASATYDASNVLTYYTSFPTAFWQGYRSNTECRSGATYDYVGVSGFASQSDYADYANQYDTFRTGDAMNVPYIIRAYTEKSGNVYLARCLSGNKDYKSRITFGNGDFDVAAGFRGIGSIYLDNNYVRLKIQYLDGNDNTLTLHMKYLEYEHDDVKSSPYIANQNSAGFGLFNSLYVSNASANDSIRNFTLSGSIYYDLYYVTTGLISNYLFGPDSAVSRTAYDKFTRTRRITHLSVGGVIGLSKDKFWIQDVVFNNFEVDGAKYAGGYVGFLWQNSAASTIKFVKETSNPGYISVTGGLVAGGFIGRCYLSKNLTIEGVSSGTSVNIYDICIKSANPKEILDYKGNNEIGVGGIIGLYYSDRSAQNSQIIPMVDELGADISSFAGFKNKRKLTINNILLTKYSTYGTIRVLNANAVTSLTNNDNTSNYAGGFVGSISDTWFVMDNCRITGISISGTIAGGIIGRASQQFLVDITNTIVDGDSKAATISGYFYAGGVFGLVDCHDVHYICCDTFTVKDYNIETTMTTAVNSACGGVIGLVNGSTSDGSDNTYGGAKTITNQYYAHPVAIQNALIKDNLIITRYNNTSTSGTGGLIGAIVNDLVKITGYNIYLNGNTLKHYDAGAINDTYSVNSEDNRRIGELIGNNSNSSPIKYVGVSISTSSYVGVLVGGANDGSENFGSSTNPYYLEGEVILANYYSVVSREDDNFSYIQDSVSNLDDCTTVSSASPYITTNPILANGGIDFTGDGFATSINGLAVKAIINDGASGMYGYMGSKYYNGSNGDTNFSAFDQSKLVMFKSEATTFDGTDFPVILIENASSEVINRLINSYIRIISNTDDYDFGVDQAYLYQVYIYNMVYNGSTFTASATGASLKRSGGNFLTTQNAFDSGKNQFSMIDVRFLNPANTTEVAYHLYIPVYVKKILSYKFDIAIQSGTTYLESQYTSNYGVRAVENIGTPFTLFFKYTYSKTLEEWESSINGGEDVYRSYNKTLTLTKTNSNEILKNFPADTVLVLVDKNRGGKPYYATIGAALNNSGVLNLSAFQENMTKVNDVLTFSGDYFAPVTFNDMMTLTATPSASGTLVITTEDDETVVIGNTKYRLATEAEKADENVTKYTISVTGNSNDVLTESYYISVLTESNAINDELLISFIFSTPTKFSETDYPAERVNAGSEPQVQILMGKIFEHTSFTVESSADSLIMSSTNRDLTISMSALLGLNSDLDDLKTSVQSYIGATNVYQSFLVYLNRKEGGDIVKAILGDPVGSGEYRIGANSAVNYSTIRVTNTHAEFVTGDLSSVFALGNDFTITASVTLTYDSSAKISAQFPGRNALQKDNGVTVSGASHLAFTVTSTTYSKNSIGADESPAKSYYSDTDPEVASLDLNPIGDRLGDYSPLGINALNIDDASYVTFDLFAVLDTTAIRALITDYTKAVVTVKLYQRDPSTGKYETALTGIDDYISIEFEGQASPSLNPEETQFSIEILKAALTDNEAEIAIPVIHCTVTTGAALQASGLAYSNYKLEVSVVLKDSSNEPISASSANNYIIYTNAKIIPNYIG